MSYSKRIIRNELAKAWANALNNLELDLNIVRVSFCEGFDAGEVYRKEQHDNFLNEHRLEQERSQKLVDALKYIAMPNSVHLNDLSRMLHAQKALEEYEAGL